MEYRIEDLKFLNMSKGYCSCGKSDRFEIESELSIEGKIQFIDELKDGVASYLLSIINKWEQEKDSLPKDKWGSPKTTSKKAWIKRNDTREIIDVSYKIGRYYLFGTQYNSLSMECPYTEYGRSLCYTGDNIVNQWFHDLCNELSTNERKYDREHNPFYIKLDKVRSYAEEYGTFNSKILNDIKWNTCEAVTEEQLDNYINHYRRIEKIIDEMSKEIIKMEEALNS